MEPRGVFRSGQREVDALTGTAGRPAPAGVSPAGARLRLRGGPLTQALAIHFDEVVGVDVAASMIKGGRALRPPRRPLPVRAQHRRRSRRPSSGRLQPRLLVVCAPAPAPLVGPWLRARARPPARPRGRRRLPAPHPEVARAAAGGQGAGLPLAPPAGASPGRSGMAPGERAACDRDARHPRGRRATLGRGGGGCVLRVTPIFAAFSAYARIKWDHRCYFAAPGRAGSSTWPPPAGRAP